VKIRVITATEDYGLPFRLRLCSSLGGSSKRTFQYEVSVLAHRRRRTDSAAQRRKTIILLRRWSDFAVFTEIERGGKITE